MGRAKPASRGRGKTGHFEAREIGLSTLAFGGCREPMERWPINSRWRKYKQFWHLRAAAGPIGTSPANWAFIARRLDATFDCPAAIRPRWDRIQNRPARPSAHLARPSGRSALRRLRLPLRSPAAGAV